MGRRLPSVARRLRIDLDMRPPNASPPRTALPTAHFERNDITIICETVHSLKALLEEQYQILTFQSTGRNF